MKEKHKDFEERLVIGGVFALLFICIVIEAIRGQAVDLNNILNALVIVLTSVGSHLFGKNAAIAAPESPKDGTTNV
ncbi:MAG: hypothetical protein V6Z81_06560 [Parvularculales bacterium]